MPTLPELLRAASRTFAVGIERLPADLRAQVQVSYLLLRVSDYLEDNELMTPAEKESRLLAWDDVLRGEGDPAAIAAAVDPADPTPDALVSRHAPRVMNALSAVPASARAVIVQHVSDSTRGMARWAVRGPRIEDEAALDDYMHEVAGRVGWLLTDLFALHSRAIAARRDRMMELGREFGLGLQTINVIRGLRKDFERGWIFVPESFAADAGIRREAMFEPVHHAAAMEVLDRLVSKADRHMRAAVEYVELIPRRYHRIRIFCLLPLFFGVRTLAVSRNDQRVFSDEVKIGREEVKRITRETVRRGWSNRWIRRRAAELGAV